jgi:hypothetical protein
MLVAAGILERHEVEQLVQILNLVVGATLLHQICR